MAQALFAPNTQVRHKMGNTTIRMFRPLMQRGKLVCGRLQVSGRHTQDVMFSKLHQR